MRYERNPNLPETLRDQPQIRSRTTEKGWFQTSLEPTLCRKEDEKTGDLELLIQNRQKLGRLGAGEGATGLHGAVGEALKEALSRRSKGP